MRKSHPGKGGSLEPCGAAMTINSKSQVSGLGYIYTRTDKQLPSARRRKIESIAFWLVGDFRLPSRWCAPFFDDGRTRVCSGPLPSAGPDIDAVWIWEPSGYQREVGLANSLYPGHRIAEDIASLIPGAVVADGRP